MDGWIDAYNYIIQHNQLDPCLHQMPTQKFRFRCFRLVPGWFNETIPAFRAGLEAAGGATIRLLHIDAGQDEGNGWCISAAWKTSHKRMQHGVFTYT